MNGQPEKNDAGFRVWVLSAEDSASVVALHEKCVALKERADELNVTGWDDESPVQAAYELMMTQDRMHNRVKDLIKVWMVAYGISIDDGIVTVTEADHLAFEDVKSVPGLPLSGVHARAVFDDFSRVFFQRHSLSRMAAQLAASEDRLKRSVSTYLGRPNMDTLMVDVQHYEDEGIVVFRRKYSAEELQLQEMLARLGMKMVPIDEADHA